MRKSPILFLFLGASVVSLGWGCGDDGGGTGGSGASSGEPCDRDSDCDNTDCTFGFCISGFCENQQADDGPAPGAEQVDGDCMSINCKAGELVTENAADPAEDPDGSDCMIPSCEQGENVMVADELGSGCDAGNGSGICDDAGVCSCEILPAPDNVAWVDPDNGQDVATNGGAPGSCAFATVEYALTQATGEIRLPPQDFTLTETLVLTGEQFINCAFDDQNNVRTRLLGSGTYGSDTAAVAFEGTRNGIDDCEIDLQNAGTAAVIVTSTAMGVPHFVDDAIIRNSGGDGIRVDGGNVEVTDSTIQDNAGVGLSFTPLDATGNLEDNTFTGNTTADVSCADESMSVVGQNNNLTTCTTCVNCNF
jgi:hypothetical protein